MAQRGTRKVMLAIVVSILLGIFLPPLINVNRYRSTIADSIGSAVGRPVTVGHLELRLLPQPGFDLRNVRDRQGNARRHARHENATSDIVVSDETD